MNDALRFGKMVSYGTMLLLTWSFMPMMLPPAFSQPKEPVPVEPVVPSPGAIDAECRGALEKLPCQGIEPGSGRIRACYDNNKGKLTPSCRQQVDERPSEAAAIMAMAPAAAGSPPGAIDAECRAALEKLPCKGIEPGSGRIRACYDNNKGKLTPSCRQQVDERPSEAAAIFLMAPAAAAAASAKEAEPIIERKRVRPSETYLAGFGGSTFGGKINGLEGTGLLSGFNRDDRDLADSGIYGAKLGHFFGNRMDWLGIEMEAFNASPHVEQKGQVPGAHLRMTTLAFNLIGRLKFACKTNTDRTETRTEGEKRIETRYEREFCRLQPYGGVGLGVFFADFSSAGNNVSDNAVPGLNALAGLRFYFNEHIALFGEYKYNYVVLDASTSGPAGGAVGFRGDYQMNAVVGGLSFHF